MTRRGLGAGAALLFCPCHLPLYGMLLLGLGVSMTFIAAWLVPSLAVLFSAGMVLMLVPTRRSVGVVCCAPVRSEAAPTGV